MDDLFTPVLQRLLQDRCTPQVVRAIEAGGSGDALWSVLEASGAADALLPESAGGAGLDLQDVYPLFELCGRHAVPLPLGHTLLARALLCDAGLPRPTGSITLATSHPLADGSLRCAQVAFGRVAGWVLTADAGGLRLLAVAQAHSEPGVFPLDTTLSWSAASVNRATRVEEPHDLPALQACVNAALIAGALMDVFERCLLHANTREQFGRPLGKFQALQHQLAVLSEHVFAARMAAQIGCRARGHRPDRLRVAVAKARTSEAALEGAAMAHALHGAIGFTAEFDLQLYTRRLHAWRQAAGSESHWQQVLGVALLEAHDGLALDLMRATTDGP